MSTLQETIGGRTNMSAYALDADDPAAIAIFTEQVVAEHPKLTVLINNAGIMRYEYLIKTRDLSDAEGLKTTNLLGRIHLTNALLDHLTSQPNPMLVRKRIRVTYLH